jgi:farnesyl-diphosphate farnesyltransferase
MNGPSGRTDLIEIDEHSSKDPKDLEFCARMLPRVSRTFAPSIQNLPPGLCEPVCIAYLLCRTVDTIEDDRRLARAQRVALFDAFDGALASAAAGHAQTPCVFEEMAQAAQVDQGANRELCVSAGAVFRAFAALPPAQRRVIEPRVLEMSTGMREYSGRADAAGGIRLHDVEDLERYCYYVAGTVGELLTDLFLLECPVEPARSRELLARATRFGAGLQLVNILKDVGEDAERGDVFLPGEPAREHGVDVGRLLNPDGRAGGLALLRSVARLAHQYLATAEEYTLLWPFTRAGREVRLFCAGPLALAFGTLQQIELGHDALLPNRAPTVTRTFVGRVFEEIRSAMEVAEQAESDHRLSNVFERARVGLAGRPSRPPAPSNGAGRPDRAQQRAQESAHDFKNRSEASP